MSYFGVRRFCGALDAVAGGMSLTRLNGIQSGFFATALEKPVERQP